jgi:hypothetical protein
MSEHGFGQDNVKGMYGSLIAGYEDADLPDAPKEPEEAPEKDPEVQESNATLTARIVTLESTLAEKLDGVQHQHVVVMDRLDVLTGAVNQFGSMLDYIVQTVTVFGKQISEGGLSGIMGMLKGGVKE